MKESRIGKEFPEKPMHRLHSEGSLQDKSKADRFSNPGDEFGRDRSHALLPISSHTQGLPGAFGEGGGNRTTWSHH
jgi:hypothetical protein